MLKDLYNFFAKLFGTKAPLLNTAAPIVDPILSAIEPVLTEELTKQNIDPEKVSEIVDDVLSIVGGVVGAHAEAETHTAAAVVSANAAQAAVSKVDDAHAALAS